MIIGDYITLLLVLVNYNSLFSSSPSTYQKIFPFITSLQRHDLSAVNTESHYTLFCTLYYILYFTLNSYLHCIVMKMTNEQYQIVQNEHDNCTALIECEIYQRLKSP